MFIAVSLPVRAILRSVFISGKLRALHFHLKVIERTIWHDESQLGARAAENSFEPRQSTLK